MDALIECLPAGSLDRLQAVVADAAEDLDHLPITIIAALQLAPDRRHRRGQHPVLERGAITQRTRFARKNRHIMPWVIGGLAAAEDARMLRDDIPVLANDDPVRIGMHIDRSAHCG